MEITAIKKITKKPGNVFFIGLLSFFGGVSQDIFVPVLPLYLANVLHLSQEFIGLSEGLVTAGVSIFRLIAGFLSDKFGKRKPLIFVGYALSLIGRFLLAFFTAGSVILGLRFLDGAGKGVKDSPKDALIAGSTVPGTRGRSFGIARMLDTLGSVVGPLLLFVLFYFLRANTLKYHYILIFSAVPLIATLSIIIFKVKETARPTIAAGAKPADGKLPGMFYAFLGIVALFTLGNSSDAFLILRAQNVGVTLLAIPLVYALFNFVYAAASVPLGSLSDKIGREKVILLGWLAYAVSYAGFALAKLPIHIWLLFAFYGIYYATTYGVAKALIADLVAESKRGRAYGIYNTTVGLIALPASVLAGFLWDKFNPAAPFYFGAVVALISALILGIVMFGRRGRVKLAPQM